MGQSVSNSLGEALGLSGDTDNKDLAVTYIARLINKIANKDISEQMALSIHESLLKKRRVRRFRPEDLICERGKKCAPFIFIEGKIRVGEYDVTRPGLFAMECAYGFDSLMQITALEKSVICSLNPKSDLRWTNSFSLMVCLAPIFPLKYRKNRIMSEINPRRFHRDDQNWKIGIAASYADNILRLSNPDEQFDINSRPDYGEYVKDIMTAFKDVPSFITVPQKSTELILQRQGEVPTFAWLLCMGSVRIADKDDFVLTGDTLDSGNIHNDVFHHLEDSTMTDSDEAAVLESETCLQEPPSKTYILQPGSFVVSICRKSLVAIQFLKTFNMHPHEAIAAAKSHYVVKLKKGQIIEDRRFFKGIIFFGKLEMVSLPPGRASEAETTRQSMLSVCGNSKPIAKRKSCRIATYLDCAFEKCSPFDTFKAVEYTIALVSIGIPENNRTISVLN